MTTDPPPTPDATKPPGLANRDSLLGRYLHQRPVGVIAIMIAFVVMGLLAVPYLPIDIMPSSLGGDSVWIRASMPTESSEEALNELTRPLEEIMRVLPGVESVASSTTGGGVGLTVSPSTGVSPDELAGAIAEALEANAHRLPADANRPTVHTWSADQFPALVIALGAGDQSAPAFAELLDQHIVPTVLRVPGVGAVDEWTDDTGRIVIAFEPNRTAAAAADPRAIIQHLTASEPVGWSLPVRDEHGRPNTVTLRVNAPDHDTEGIRRLPVERNTELRSVAAVSQIAPGADHRMLIDGRPGLWLAVYRAPDANSYRTAHAAEDAVQRFADEYGLSMTTVYGTNRIIDSALHELAISAAWGGVLAALVLLLVLRRVRLALIVGGVLPVSVALAVMLMAVTDGELNIFVLVGFLLAMGMVVDNAIVVIEAMRQAAAGRTREEHRRLQSRAVADIGLAITVSTLTTVVIFLPFLTIGHASNLRTLIVAIATPIAWSLLASLAVALILVPMAFQWFDRQQQQQIAATKRVRPRRGRLERWYGQALAGVLSRPLLCLLLIVGLIGPAIILGVNTPASTGETEQDHRQIRIRATERTSASIDEQLADLERWRAEIEPHRERLGITSIISRVRPGRADMRLYLEPIDPLGRTSDDIENEVDRIITPGLHLATRYHREQARSLARLPDGSTPEERESRGGGWRRRRGRFGGGGDANRPVTIRITHPDASRLPVVWNQLSDYLRAADVGVREPLPDPFGDTAQQLELVMRPEAAQQGYGTTSIGQQVRAFAALRPVTQVDSTWDVEVGRLRRESLTLARLMNIPVSGEAGSTTVGSLVQTTTRPTPNTIERRDGMAEVELRLRMEDGMREAFLEQVPRLARLADLSPGSGVSLGRHEQRAADDMVWIIAGAVTGVFLMFALMALLYESVLAPLAVMLTVPLALTTVLMTIKIMAIPLDELMWLGLLILLGIAVNNGVVLVDRLARTVPLSRCTSDPQVVRALAGAARTRLGAVLLTSATTVCGAIPMAVGTGQIAGIALANLGTTVAIGLAGATLFTLVVVPIAYYWLGRLRTGWSHLWRSNPW